MIAFLRLLALVVSLLLGGLRAAAADPAWAKLQYPGTQSGATGHQGNTGHAILAQAAIVGLGWGTDVSSATIAYNGGSPSTSASSQCLDNRGRRAATAAP